MPELPEVETVVRQIAPVIVGRTFKHALLRGKGKQGVLHQTLSRGISLLPGATVLEVYRKGKFIVLRLSGGLAMVVHLRMTGMLLFEPSARLKKFIRAEFRFGDGFKMYFSDIRRFGRIWVADEREAIRLCGLGRLGPDPLEEGFSAKDLAGLLMDGRGTGRRRGILKSALLNQQLIAGIGNIYADEICFRARLHPRSRLEKLRQSDLDRLHEAILYCLDEGIRHNGTTISDFVGTRGEAGEHQQYLCIYGRKGKPCCRCGQPVRKRTLAGRGTHFCINCQPLRK